MSTARYYLKAEWHQKWEEVTEEEFARAERAAGFYPKPGCGPVATGGFSNGLIEGKVRYE